MYTNIIVNICALQIFFCGLFCASDYGTKSNVFAGIFGDTFKKNVFCTKKNKFIFVNFERILRGLQEYQDAEVKFEQFVESKQKMLSEEEQSLNKEMERIESDFKRKKAEIKNEINKARGISNETEESLSFSDSEGQLNDIKNEYKRNMTAFKGKYADFMNGQKRIEEEIQKKKDELFLPLDKMVRQYISEFAVFLGKAVSSELTSLKNKEVKVDYIVLDKKCIAENRDRIKKISCLDVTDMVEEYIKKVRKDIGAERKNVVLSEKLKNKKNKN